MKSVRHILVHLCTSSGSTTLQLSATDPESVVTVATFQQMCGVFYYFKRIELDSIDNGYVEVKLISSNHPMPDTEIRLKFPLTHDRTNNNIKLLWEMQNKYLELKSALSCKVFEDTSVENIL